MNTIERENRIQQALKDCQTDSELSQRQIAAKNGIPASTLSARLHGRPSRTNTRHTNAKLTFHQEAVLAKLIRSSQQQFRPVHYPEVRAIANRMARENNANVSPIGINWVTKFISRQPGLRSLREQHLEIERVLASNPAILS